MGNETIPIRRIEWQNRKDRLRGIGNQMLGDNSNIGGLKNCFQRNRQYLFHSCHSERVCMDKNKVKAGYTAELLRAVGQVQEQ